MMDWSNLTILKKISSRHMEMYIPLKRDHKNEDKDKDPSAGSNQGMKKQKMSKDAEPPKGSKSKESKTSSSKGTKSQPKSSRKSVQAEELVFEVGKTPKMPQEKEVTLKINPMSAITDQLDWNNPEGYEYPFDLSKPLPFIKAQGRQVVLADYFFNNDLEYLKGRSSSRKYTTSTTKTKAAKYGFQESKHDVFSKKRIITVTHVKVIKWYGYRYLEEIIVRREDQMLYKFKEGDISRLNMHDIEDLLLLLLVEDLQLGFESYQKKLNISKLETFRSDISKMTPYTAYKNPQGIIYQDKLKRNMLMSSDELYKFCDGTLISIRWVLYDIDSKLSMIYLPKRR
ncbi:hypothetical protein Tco_0749012 [Tanacetum coccineum]|uniref:Uncharacterized protein n=1 Tax=Tanacetum coccineum TaxID=301880 RepID=A0ABQ4YZR7_9ASTR